MKFAGSYVALLTPFDSKGSVDLKTLRKLVEWHIKEGTDGIVCCATTGEGPALNDKDRKKIASTCIEISQGRIPIIVATGVSDTRTSVKYTEEALKLKADGCLVVTPYYNKPTQKGCILHFKEIASVGVPLILYNNPARAVVRLSLETVLALSEIPNIVAFKESGRDLDLVKKIAPHIDVFVGDDDMTYEIMKAGGVGTISPCANLFPQVWKGLIQASLEKRWDDAKKIMERFLPFCHSVFLETNPQGPKFALSWMGKCKPFFRLPMVLPNEETQMEIKKEMLHLALPFAQSIKIPISSRK